MIRLRRGLNHRRLGVGISKMMVIAAFFPSKSACVMLRSSIASRTIVVCGCEELRKRLMWSSTTRLDCSLQSV